MGAISKRLANVEKVFAPATESEDRGGSMAEFRDELLAHAEQHGATSVAEVGAELEQLGPLGLWREAARGYLSGHRVLQTRNQSPAATKGRAVGISTPEVSGCISRRRIESAMLETVMGPWTEKLTA